ncbi:hypothetical protein [Roseomonas sp. USHLN139]|uniref:hypothetical protein n=1 Tax=Roseomonas sp. USHLN139 TaxID=3081298 RepID=UPI003B022169
MVPTLQQGVVRGGTIEMSILFPDLSRRDLTISILTGAGPVVVAHCVWPTDFQAGASVESGTAESGHSGRLVLPVQPSWPPFSQVVVEQDATPLPVGEAWCLTGLFAFSERQFEKHFFRHRNRVQDRETLVFSARQILDHYSLNASHLCVAAVIYAYRAVDLGEAAGLRQARQDIRDVQKRLGTVASTGEARTDRDHLAISLLMALWHVDLALQDHDAFLATLDEAISHSRLLASPMTATSYNLSRILLLRGWLFYQLGEPDKAIELYNYNFDFYARSLRNIEKNLARFIEQKETHHAVALSLNSLEKINTRKRNIEKHQVFDAVCRTRSPEGIALLKRSLDGLLRRIRLSARG